MTTVVKTIFEQNRVQFGQALTDGANKFGNHVVGEKSQNFIYELGYKDDLEK